MQPSVLNIFDDVDAPLLDYITSRSDDRAPTAPPPERPSLDSGRLLQIFGAFLHPSAGFPW